jgi:hypothetical protein
LNAANRGGPVHAVPEIVRGRVVSSKQAPCIYCRL